MDEEGAVLGAGLSAAERTALAAVLDATVTAVEPPATGAVGPRDVVVVGHDPPAVDAREYVAALAGDAPTACVVVYADADDDALAADVVGAGASGYVPHRRGVAALAGAVTEARERAARRHRRARDADILDEMLYRSPIELYAKDTEARHVRSTKTVTHDDVAGLTETEFDDGARGETIANADRTVLETEEPVEGELTHYDVQSDGIDDLDGGWLRTWTYPRYEDGDLRGLVGFVQDVTGVVETERELTRKNDLLQQFASVVSHDLRNPLNLAQGHLELARESGDDASFDAVARAHDRIAEIIDDLLRLTRESDQSPSLASVSLAAQARAAWETVETGAATLRVDVEGVVVRADAGLLQQLFENLFRNAVEHGGADVTVTVTVTERGFAVADDGPGLPDTVVDAVASGGFTTGGLGLNIVHTIADRHGWSLAAGESAAGGARFDVTGCTLIGDPATTAADRRARDLNNAVAVGQFSGGEFHESDGRWTVSGGGRNLWRDVNEFYFVYGATAGDADFVARLADFDPTAGKSKAGVMVRDGTEAESPHAYVGVSRETGTETLWQLDAGHGTQSRVFDDEAWPPVWLRVKRHGDTVTVFQSADGQEWEAVDEQTVSLSERALYGLVVCSHDVDDRATATFDDVSLDAVTWE